MRATNRSVRILLVAVLAVALAACARGDLDDPETADVVLSVGTFPVITAATTQGSTAAGTCTILLPAPVSVTLLNQPKNALGAESPFNDIFMQSVTVDYEWSDGTVFEDVVIPLAGTIKANGSGQVQFPPLSDDVLPADPFGRSANMILIFRGTTASGHLVESLPVPPTGATAFVNSCPP